MVVPIKRYGRGEAAAIHRWDGGLSWVAHPDEAMLRASHAIAVAADDDPNAESSGSDPADV